MKKIIPISVATLSGVLILAGYYFQVRSGGVLAVLIHWAVLLVSTAALLGFWYLIRNHINKILQKKKGRVASIILLISFVTTLIMGFIYTLESEFFRELILNIQIPVEASLLAVLAVVLFATSTRLVKVRGWTPLSIGFLISTMVFLFLDLGWLRAESSTPAAAVINLIRRIPSSGARGILLGMALGGAIIGLRILLAMDQPFDEGK